MITTSKLAIAIAVAGPLAAATVGESSATPLPSSTVAVKAAAPAAATDVQYRAYGYGPYAYRPYGGYPYPMEAIPTGTPPIPIGIPTPGIPGMAIIEMARPSTLPVFARVMRSSECLEQSVARIMRKRIRSACGEGAMR